LRGGWPILGRASVRNNLPFEYSPLFRHGIGHIAFSFCAIQRVHQSIEAIFFDANRQLPRVVSRWCGENLIESFACFGALTDECTVTALDLKDHLSGVFNRLALLFG
jgi:hypothetical protein